MRGYTATSLEYVSKLHKDAKIRAMSDSKVRRLYVLVALFRVTNIPTGAL